jgi:hypothetical protein
VPTSLRDGESGDPSDLPDPARECRVDASIGPAPTVGDQALEGDAQPRLERCSHLRLAESQCVGSQGRAIVPFMVPGRSS